MKIFLDTNSIINEGFFRSSTAIAFLKAAKLLGYEIHVPEAVVDEVIGNFSTQLKEKRQALKTAHKGLRKLIDIEDIDIDLEDEIADFENKIDEIFDTYDVNILKYPKLKLKDLIVKQYEGKKPFKTSGEGHKDLIIWKTMVEEITPSPEKGNYFITENASDFSQSKDKIEVLHPDLAADVEPEKVPQIYSTIRNFFEDKIRPQLTDISLKDIPDLSNDELVDEVQSHLENDLSFYSAYGIEGLPFSGDITVVSVGVSNIRSIVCSDVGDDILITVEGEVSLEVHGFIDKFDLYHEYGEKDFYVIDGNHNDHVAEVGSEIDTAFRIDLSYNKEHSEINSHEITLPDEIEPDYY